MENSKNHEKYFCETCNFKTSHKNDYSRHLLTSKHQKWVAKSEMETAGNNKTQGTQGNYSCEKCNKGYSTVSGLWKHKKKCITNEPSDKELLLMLIKEQSEFKKLVLEVYENIKHNI
jgi:hypothetical protein